MTLLSYLHFIDMPYKNRKLMDLIRNQNNNINIVICTADNLNNINQSTMDVVVYLNGAFIPKEKAFISPDDRGFYFADGIYEVIKYYKGRSFRFCDHMERLTNSLTGAKISFTEIAGLESLCDDLIRLNGHEKDYTGIYLQITRGTFKRMHRFPEIPVSPTVYLNSYPLPPFIPELSRGIKVIVREDIRWHRCDIKSIMLLPNVLMNQEAVEEGARECFLVRDGKMTESTHSNIFGIKKGEIYTHPDSCMILPGITKKVVLEICREKGIQVHEVAIPVKDLSLYDEFFITGTGNEVMPVVKVDDMVVGNGKPGVITQQIQQEFFGITYGELAGDYQYRGWK
jgi:D-alanine transaminase